MPLTPALQRRGRQISTEFEAKETLSQKSNTINKKKNKKKKKKIISKKKKNVIHFF